MAQPPMAAAEDAAARQHLDARLLRQARLDAPAVAAEHRVLVDDCDALHGVAGLLAHAGEEVEHRRREVDIGRRRPEEPAQPLLVQAREFEDAIRNRRKPLSDGVFGVDVVQVLDAIDLSIRLRGKPVAIRKR